MHDAGEVMEKAGKAFTDTGKVGKKFNPDHPEGTAGGLHLSIHLYTYIFCCSALHSCTIRQCRQRSSTARWVFCKLADPQQRDAKVTH